MGDPYAAQLRAAEAEGELAAIRDALREFAEETGLNPEMEPSELLAKAAGAFRSCAAMSDARYAEIQGLRSEMEAMRTRLVPEGMEWLLEVWPKWSNGEYCKFGDWWTADKYGDFEPRQLRRLVFYTPEQLREWEQDEGDNFGYEWDFMRPSDTTYRPDKSEPPVPKVLDADGVEIHVGDEVWHVRGEFGPRFVSKFETHDGRPVAVFEPNGTDLRGCECDQLTHRAPVLAADGKPLREGETVWHKSGLAYGVVETIDADSLMHTTRYRGDDGTVYRDAAKDLVHKRPDSWERLKEDANKNYTEYWECDGIPCYDCPAIVDGKQPDKRYKSANCSEAVKCDLVRRAKKLAGVE